MTAYAFDLWGWYTGEVADGSPRATQTAPANTSTTTAPGALRANWSGLVWVEAPYAVPPDLEFAAARRIVRARLRERRQLAEVSGVTVGAHLVPTDPAFRQRVAEIKAWSDDNLTEDVPVERADGTFVMLTRAQIVAVYRAIMAHIKACATVERLKVEEAAALATTAELQAYDIEAGWPT